MRQTWNPTPVRDFDSPDLTTWRNESRAKSSDLMELQMRITVREIFVVSNPCESV